MRYNYAIAYDFVYNIDKVTSESFNQNPISVQKIPEIGSRVTNHINIGIDICGNIITAFDL
jgi:hypothetical protein